MNEATEPADAVPHLYKYGRGIVPFIDLFAEPRAAARAEVGFLRARIRVDGSVLDIGAGVGELAIALAAGGFNVTALEPDPEMYGGMLARLAGRGELARRLSPVPRPIGFDLQQRFDACLSLAVLHLLDAPSRRAMVEHAAGHLNAGGLLVIEAPVECAGRPEIPRQLKAERTFGNTHYQHYHSARRVPGGRWHTSWEFVTKRGESVLDHRVQTFDWSPLSLDELTELVRQGKFSVDETFGDFDGGRYVEGSSRAVVVVARKMH